MGHKQPVAIVSEEGLHWVASNYTQVQEVNVRLLPESSYSACVNFGIANSSKRPEAATGSVQT
jgi:hypothetical protein